jgi:D-alanine-D-alanine ligase
VQKFAAGTEITVGVLATPDLLVLPTLEIVSDNPVYDYDAKYTAGKSHHIIPARIPERAQSDASDAAKRAFVDLGCAGMARVDIIVDAQVSLLPDAARAAGIAFEELCHRLVDHAIGRRERRVGPPAE